MKAARTSPWLLSYLPYFQSSFNSYSPPLHSQSGLFLAIRSSPFTAIMGFLGLVPADQVTAEYLVEKHMLLLQASGTVPVATSGIQFDPQPWLGALKYALEGWTGPLTGETESYNVELGFTIQLPNPALPTDSVVVVTANHPEGLVVPIRFTGLIVPPKTADPPPVASPTPLTLTTNVAGDEQINALYKTSFQIKENASVPSMGSVNIKFDDQFLALESAGIDGSNIVWTFTSLKMGTTQVIVTVHGGIAQFIQIKTYTIHVFLPGLGEKQGEGEPQAAAANKQTSVVATGAEKAVFPS
jgi:hypothetical protein